jgi:DNA-binding transcriptional LysR family regulator
MNIHLTGRYVDIVEGSYDLALRMSGRLDDTSLIAQRLVIIPRGIYASPGYVDKHGVGNAFCFMKFIRAKAALRCLARGVRRA